MIKVNTIKYGEVFRQNFQDIRDRVNSEVKKKLDKQ